jgi:hypothetical protein
MNSVRSTMDNLDIQLGVGEIERYKSIERSKCGRPHHLSDNRCEVYILVRFPVAVTEYCCPSINMQLSTRYSPGM